MHKNTYKKLLLFTLSLLLIASGYWLTKRDLIPQFADTLSGTEEPVLSTVEGFTGNELNLLIKRADFYHLLVEIKEIENLPLKKAEERKFKDKKLKTKTLTKEELVKTVCKIEKWKTKKPKTKPFTDIKTTDSLAPCIAYAKSNKFLDAFGKQKAFSKKRSVKKREAVLFLEKIYNVSLLNKPLKPAAPEIRAIEETAPAEEPAVPPFTPVSPAFITEDFFETVNLNKPLPNTFYKDEVYLFEGEIEGENFDQAFVFLMQENNAPKNFVGGVENRKFSIPVLFRRPGNYQLGIIRGASGQSKVADISVLEDLETANSAQNTSQASNLAYKYERGKTILSWRPGGDGNIVKLNFAQNNKTSNYLFRTPVSRFELLTENLAKFSPGAGEWLVETAKWNGLTPNIQIESSWIPSEKQTVIFAVKGLATIGDNDIQVSGMTETLNSPCRFQFSGKNKKKLAAKGYYTLPNGKVASFLLKEGNPVNPIEEDANLDIKLNFEDAGVYIFELNDTEGSAVVNTPVYCGNNLLPLIPDFFAQNESELNPDSEINPAEAKQELLGLVNKARRTAGLNEVALDESLSIPAQKHSDDMVQRNFFGHYNPSNKGPEDRRKDAKYPMPVRENLCKAPTVEYCHEGLMRSPIHRDTVLAENVTRVGIGITEDAEGYLLGAEEFSSEPFTEEILEQWKNEFIAEIQRMRAYESIADLAMNASMDAIAREWSADMAEKEYLSFENSQGENLLAKVRGAGFRNTIQAFIVQGGEKDKLLEEILNHPPVKDSKFKILGLGIAANSLSGIVSITILYSY